MTMLEVSSCCGLMLKLTDSLKTGSRVFFLIVVFFVLIGFSKCTRVIFTNGSAKIKGCCSYLIIINFVQIRNMLIAFMFMGTGVYFLQFLKGGQLF